jgi:hypothetical protein
MATFNELVKAVAMAEGLDEMTVRGIGIKVRDAGHISKRGRGPSAAQMTVRDAAMLLIGVNAPGLAKDAGLAVEEYLQTKVAKSPTPVSIPNEFSRLLQRGKPLGEALEAVLGTFVPDRQGSVRVTEGVKAFLEADQPPTLQGVSRSQISFYVAFRRSTFGRRTAEINIRKGSELRMTRIAQAMFWPADFTRGSSDRVEEIRITERTLAAVGQALAT